MAGLDLGAGKDAGPLVSRLDTYYEDPNLVKGKVRSNFLTHYDIPPLMRIFVPHKPCSGSVGQLPP